MSIIANKVDFKIIALLSLLLIGLFASSAFALDKTSTANLNYASQANGRNINIWDGAAKISGSNTTSGSQPTFSAVIRKSVTLLPDPEVYHKNLYSRGSFGPTKVSISSASTYYAQAQTLSPVGSGKVTVVSLDK
ncbi:hypothetical protein [Priestia megaterium]|jgi:hypothetical protein|uniref:hypothetical protein n=1 Tax=Priestia megaterium TaxID=1404 RepID=UPI00298D20BB|nr:hypothetical protein [Priestia megaterium]